MKLLKQTSLNFISASVFFFLIAIIIIYISVRMMANYYIETELIQKQQQFFYNFVNSENTINYFNTDVSLIEYNNSIDLSSNNFSDTIMYNPINKSYQLNKKLKFYLKKNNNYYVVEISQSQSFIDLYVMVFSLSLLFLVGILFIILFIVNRHSIKVTLKVFYQTIKQLNNFNVNDKLSLDQDVEIDEFRSLNKTLNLMSERIKQDFINLKQYSENTSHELQTPLAILYAKLEELLQSDNLTEKQLIEISELINTVDRLSNINKALMFLTKIDNRMFVNTQTIHVNQIIENYIELYKDLTESKKIKLNIELQKNINIKTNKILLETLINNLITNAIKHNIEEGELKVYLNNKSFIIENTGKILNKPVEQLFERFEKGNSGTKSLGIGLSIVKKICETSNYKIIYKSEGIWHRISIYWS